MTQPPKVLLSVLLISLLGACGQHPEPTAAAPAKVESPFMITVGIKDIMAHMIDPAADALWGSVSIEQTAKGTVVHQPRTEEEWKTVRGHAIALMEGANLIMM